MFRALRFSPIALIFLAGVCTQTALFSLPLFAQPVEADATGDTEADEERAAYERFLSVLRRRPAPGTALDRVYSYHQDFGTLSDFCASLKTDAATSTDGIAPLILGLMEFRQGHESQAISALESAEKQRPQDYICSWTLGQALGASGRFQEAVTAYERALTRNPARADRLSIFMDLGRAARLAGGSDAALAVWKRLEAEQPNDARVLEMIASVSFEEGDIQSALQRYEALAEKTTDEYKQTQFRLKAATLRLRLGDRKAARSVLERLLDQLDSDSWMYRDVREQLEASYLEAGDSAGLFAWFEARLKDHPDELATIIRLAELNTQQGKKAEAREWYTKAIEVAPSNVELRESLIDFLETSGDLASAIREFEQLATIAPGNLDHLEAHGRLWLRRNDVEVAVRKAKAIAIWTAILNGHEKEPDVVRRLADLLRSAEFSEEALQRYREAIELDPQIPQYRRYLGDYLFQLRRREEAISVWRDIASGDRRTADNLVELTSVFLANGLKKESMEALSAACELRPDFTQLLRLAEIQRTYEIDGKRPHITDSLNTLELATPLAESEEDRVLVVTGRIASLELNAGLAEYLKALTERITTQKAATAEDWLTLTIGYGRLEQTSKALEFAVRGRTAFPESIALLRADADLSQRTGQLANAIEAFRRLLDADRRMRQEYLVKIAELQVQIGQRQVALETGRQLLTLAPGNIENAEWFAQLCEQCGTPEEGLKVIRRLSRAAPGDIEARTLLASTLEKSQLFEEAFDVWWSLYLEAETDSARSEAIEKLSQMAMQRGTFAEVVRRLNQKLQQNEQDRTILIGLAEAHLAVQDLISARSTLERLLQRDDRSVVVIGQLAGICDRLGDFEAAAGYRRRQFRLEPNEANEGQYILALQRAGMYDEAESLIMAHIGPETSSAELLQMIDRAIEDGAIDLSIRMCNTFLERNQHPELALLRLGVLQWTEGNKEEACNTFQKILQVTQNVPFAQFFDCISPGKEAPPSRQFVDAAILRQRLFAVRVLLHLQEISEEEMQYLTTPVIGLISPPPLNRTAFSEINTTAAVREFALTALVTANVRSDEAPEPSSTATSRGENDEKASDRAAIDAWDHWICATLEPVDSTALKAVQPLLETGFNEATIAYLQTCFSMTLRSNTETTEESEARKNWSAHLPLIKRRIRQLAATDPSTATVFFAQCVSRMMPDYAALNDWITELTSEQAASADCRLGLLLEFAHSPTASPRWSLQQCKAIWQRVLTPSVMPDSAEPSDTAKGAAAIPPDLLAPWIMHSVSTLNEDDITELVSDWIELSAREPSGARLTVQNLQSANPYEDFWVAVHRSCNKRPGLLVTVAGRLEKKYRGVTGRREFLSEVALAHLATYRSDQISAARHWIRCIQFDPENTTIRREISEALQRAGLYVEAITVLDGIEEADPNRMKADELRVLRLATMTNQRDRAELSLNRLAGIQLTSQEMASLIKISDELQLTEIAAELRSRSAMRSQGEAPKTQYEYMEEYERLGKTAEAVAIAKQIARKKIGDASYNFRQQNTRSPFQMRERAFQLLKEAGVLEEMISEQKSMLNASPNSQILRDELAMFLRAAGRDKEAKELEPVSNNDDGAVSRGQVRKLLSEGNGEAASQLILGGLREPRRRDVAIQLLEEDPALLRPLFDHNHGAELLAGYFNTNGPKGASGSSLNMGAVRGLQIPDLFGMNVLAVGIFETEDPHVLLPEIQRVWKVAESSVAHSVSLNVARKKAPSTKACSALIELIGWVGEPENEGKRESRSLLVGSVLRILQQSFLQASKEERLALYETVLRVRSSHPALREWPFFVAFTASQCGQPDVATASLQSIVEESHRSPFPADCLIALDSIFPEKEDLNSVLSICEATLCSPVTHQKDESFRRYLFDTMLARVNLQGGREKFRAMIPRLKYCSQLDEYYVARFLVEHFPWQGLVALSDQTSMGRQTPEQINAVVEACAGSLRMSHLVDEWQFLQTAKSESGDVPASLEVNSEISLNTDGSVATLCPLILGIMDRPAFGAKDDPAPLLKFWTEASTQKSRPSSLFLSSAVLLLKHHNADVRRQVAERLIELARSGELYPDLSDTTSVDFKSRKQSVIAILILGRKLVKTEGCEELSEVLMTSAKAALMPVATVKERLAMAKLRGEFLLAASRRDEASKEFREVLNLLLSQPDSSARLDSMAVEALQETLDQDKTELLNELRKTGLAP